ncbi:MAG: ADP-ribosylglycohydrolase family protein, partial [Armatimonadota bacterium]
AFEAAFIDLGYARDATAMMAAMIAAASGGDATAREMVEVALAIDPFGFGDRRVMGKRLREFLAIADGASDDRELVTKLAGEVAALHPYDPIDVLGVPAAALWYAEGDPIRTIVMAVNDRDVDGDGKLVRLRDVDCTGGVAGALAGALNGADAFPDDWIADTLRANRDMYGIGIEENARRLTEVVGN